MMTLKDEYSDEEDLSSKAKRRKLDSDNTAECGIEQTLKDGSLLRMAGSIFFLEVFYIILFVGLVTCLPMSIGSLMDAKLSTPVSIVKVAIHRYMTSPLGILYCHHIELVAFRFQPFGHTDHHTELG